MSNFFHGWRRKVGCVLLVVTCLLAMVWLRSNLVRDVISLHVAYRGQVFYSASGSIYWWTVPASQIRFSTWPQWHQSLPKHLTYDGVQTVQITYDDRNQTQYYRQPIRAISIPYWLTVVPLTLLSAYLIIWKHSFGRISPSPVLSRAVPHA